MDFSYSFSCTKIGLNCHPKGEVKKGAGANAFTARCSYSPLLLITVVVQFLLLSLSDVQFIIISAVFIEVIDISEYMAVTKRGV